MSLADMFIVWLAKELAELAFPLALVAVIFVSVLLINIVGRAFPSRPRRGRR